MNKPSGRNDGKQKIEILIDETQKLLALQVLLSFTSVFGFKKR